MRSQCLLCIVTSLLLSACGGSGGSGDGGNGPRSQSSSASSSEPPSSDISGLDERPSNNECLAGEPPSSDSPSSDAGINLERVFPDLSFDRPVAMLQSPGDSSQWYLLEQSGRIFVFDNDNSASTASEFADLRDRVDDSSNANESGLLSMAFHPDYASNGEVFLYYQVSQQVSQDSTTPIEDDCCVSQLVRYEVNNNGTALDIDSVEVLLSFTAPYSSKNHFGGHLEFDEQGYLYLSIGDGGSSGDPDGRAQNTSNLWGSMIRIDVDNGSPYAIPNDNPFADQTQFLCNSDQQMQEKQAAGGQCPELYAWGLRNPWRWSFDRDTGDLWLADVGQGAWEEINLIQRGGNYGWNIREGAHCFNASSCDTADLIDPVAEVPQPDFRSITGGVVYRGEALEFLFGKYLFGDYVTGRFYTLADERAENGLREAQVLDANTGLNIASFSQDHVGEVYLLDFNGDIYQLGAGTGEPANGPERWLSNTGCMSAEDPREPASGLIPYAVNAPFWSDDADKQRWLALPDGEHIVVDSTQDWQLPTGSVVVKNFHLRDELIETRLFMHHTNGQWAGYTYAWNESGADAEIVRGGKVVERKGQRWIYPSEGECLECHTAAAGRTLGLETAQLNSELTYPSTERTANQLNTLKAIGVLTGAVNDAVLLNPYANLGEEAIADQARAYLHTNCAQCHRPDGPTNINMDLRATTPLPQMNICNVAPQNSDLGNTEAYRLTPGDADASTLVIRMNLRDHAEQMPPIGSALVDDEGVILVQDWIDSLAEESCNN